MAYINLAGGLKINTADAVDSRLVLTKAEMKSLHYANDESRPATLRGKIFQLPSNYLCVCSEDNKIYVYNVSNEEDELTGKFRKVEYDDSTLKTDIAKLENDKQDKLISGTNLKTINNISLLGSGNIVITADSIDLTKVAEAEVNQYNIQSFPQILENKENEVDIICFAGQSNSCGRALLTDVTTKYDIIPSISIDKAFTFNNGKDSVPTAIVEPISANGSSAYGYIPTFLNAYYDTCHRRVCTCYMSVGGTMLNKFMPYQIDDSDGHRIETPTTYYTNIVNRIKDCKTKLQANNFTVGKILLVWCQGESDGDYYGSDNQYANYWEKRLTTYDEKRVHYKDYFVEFVNALKTDCGLDKALIIRIGYKKNGNDFTYDPIVVAQSELGKENKNICVVSSVFAGAKVFKELDDSTRNLMRDAWHYLPEGYLRAGIEAGVNTGLYVRANFQAKPALFEYRTSYAEAINTYIPETLPYRAVDKYMYKPDYVNIDLMKQYETTDLINFTVSPTTISGAKDDTIQIEITYMPENTTQKGVTYIVADDTIASVSTDGLVTLLKEGTTSIDVVSTAKPTLRKTIDVNVAAGIIAVSSITISNTEASYTLNDTFTLNYTVLPENATNKNVIITAVPANSVTISGNQITTKDLGSCTITVASESNPSIKATYTFNVEAAPISQTTLLDLDFTQNTIQNYVDRRIVEVPTNSNIENITYNSDGLVCKDNTLPNGLKLVAPISIPDTWYIKFEVKIKPFEESGTSVAVGNYNCASIVSNTDSHSTHSLSCLSPCINIFQYNMQARFTEESTAQTLINNVFLADGNMHSYEINLLPSFVLQVKRDGVEVYKNPVSLNSQGFWGYVLGIHKGYNYSGQFAFDTGYTIKSLKITTDNV